MPLQKRQIDKRLLGTWRSDRRKTFQNFVPWPGLKGKRFQRFKGIFGRLKLKYTRNRIYHELGDYRHNTRYRVLACDPESVAILTEDAQSRSTIISHIHFYRNYYWIAFGGKRQMFEYFNRIK